MENISNYEYYDYIVQRLKIKPLDYIKRIDIKGTTSIEEIHDDRFKSFLELLKKKMPNYNFYNLGVNISSIILKNGKNDYDRKDKILLKRNVCLGQYNGYTNTILIRDEDDVNAIFHELFHMSSAVRSEKVNYGFSFHSNTSMEYQYNCESRVAPLIFGDGFNEGYTETLTEDLLGQGDAYYNHRIFARLIRLIVGEEFMTQCYLNADLYSLAHELLKYGNEDDVNNLINYTDITLKKLPIEYDDFYEKNVINYTRNMFKEIINILFKMLNNKIASLSSHEKRKYYEEFKRICSTKIEPRIKKNIFGRKKDITPKTFEFIDENLEFRLDNLIERENGVVK